MFRLTPHDVINYKMNPVELDREFPLLALGKSVGQKPTIDSRLQEALKPMVSDANLLKPDHFNTLCRDTHNVLLDRLNSRADTDEIRTDLANLIHLLKENMSLQATLEENINRVKKI